MMSHNHVYLTGFVLVPSILKTLPIDKCIEEVTEFAAPHIAELPSPATLEQEVIMWYECQKEKEVDTLIASYVLATGSPNFSNLAYLLKLMLTIPVTNASTERANSTLKFIKTKFRSTMSQSALNAFILGYKHRDITSSICADVLTGDFISMKSRRVLLANPMSE